MKNEPTPKAQARLNLIKDRKKRDELKILKALSQGAPKTMRQIEVETGVRVNVQCWAFKHFKDDSKTKVVAFGICPVSKANHVQFHSLTYWGEAYLNKHGGDVL